jgi:hypothetical protein
MKKNEIERLIELLKSRINDENCFEFSNNIDGCKISISKKGYKELKLKIKIDKCADRYLFKESEKEKKCDCIFIFSDKVCIVECTTGKFGSRDLKNKPEQIRRCYKLIRSYGYRGLIVAFFYYEHFDKFVTQKSVENRLKDIFFKEILKELEDKSEVEYENVLVKFNAKRFMMLLEAKERNIKAIKDKLKEIEEKLGQ